MTLTTPYSATFIVGDGETKTFSYLFEEVSENFISVIVYNSLTGISTTPTYVVDTDQKQVIFGDDTPAPTADETVCIYRNTPNVQDVAFRTLHGYDAKTLENILSKIVAMIQEIKSNYFSTQVLQGDPWQLDLLSSADDGATVNIDYTAKKLVKGLYFRITSGNLQVSADDTTYITMPKSDDVAEFRQYEQTLPDLTVIRKLQYRVGNQWFDAEANAQYTADEAYALAESVQTTMNAHINNTQNPHQTSLENLTDTDLTGAESGKFLQFDGVKWKAVYSTASVSWGGILGDIDDQADLKIALDSKVNKSGDTMTGALNIENIASSNTPLLTLTHSSTTTYKWNIAPRYNSTTLSVYPGSTETNGFRFATTGFVPASNNARYLGSASLKWKGIYTAMINNGGDLAVPANTTGTLATKADVDLAANSGRMITEQGVWYAKMYAATVAPAAEDGTNYADFSQVDGQGNPIIVTYNRVSGAWVQDQTIIPPAEYDGYVPITSKIWDIAEQDGQQGGRILWNHQSKEFTPYPQIVSFDGQNITNSTFSYGAITYSTFSGTATLSGISTVVMPETPTGDQIVNKDYVDNHIPTGNFYHPDLFDWKWADHQVNDVQWLRADTFSWQSGSVYQAAFDELFYDIQISTYWYSSGGPGYTKSRTPAVGDAVYLNSDLTTQIGTVDSYDDVNDEITVSGNTYSYMSNTYVTPTTETVAGYSLSVYTGHSGRKIVSASDETNVANIYTATGVAWYYIIDIPNKRFKLPRGKHNKYTETLGVVGNGRNTVYTNGTNDCVFNPYFGSSNNGIFVDRKAANIGVTVGTAMGTATNITEHTAIGLHTDPTRTNVLTTPIPQDTDQYKYLYFYVGEFTQTAIENTAGLNAELFNEKADNDLDNVLANIDFVIESQLPTAGNNYTWYRKYRSGWVEQGGETESTTTTVTVALPVEMADDHYTMAGMAKGGAKVVSCNTWSTTSITLQYNAISGSGAARLCWEVKGMAA